MIAMQYKIALNDAYDMNIIRERVKQNGQKTDGFPDLLCKAYLISENKEGERGHNEYAPLYLWKSHTGMNQFIFDGFYNNILESFGWQNIHIAIPMICDLKDDFYQSKFVIEIKNNIAPSQKMQRPKRSHHDLDCTGYVLLYNPDKWTYTEFYFFDRLPLEIHGRIYSVLHLSM